MAHLQGTQNSKDQENVRIIQAFLSGNKNAFDQLILLNQKMVFNLCYRFLGNYDDADDCAQEVFIRVYHSLKKFRFDSSFSTWLYRVAVNACKNKLNSLGYRRRLKKMSINHHKDKDMDTQSVEIQDDSQSPTKALHHKEIGQLILDAVRGLPVQQKLIVVLRDIEGKSYQEIVEITGFRLGTVKSKLARARQSLRVSLKGKI